MRPGRDPDSAADRREKSFKGVVDLVSKKGLHLSRPNESGRSSLKPPSLGDMAAAVDAAREALIEMVAEADEKLMEKFFEAGTLSDEELVSGLRSATAAGSLFPLVCTSAMLNIGIPQLLDAILAYVPSPAERPFKGVDKTGAGGPPKRRRSRSGVGIRVWKTIADPFAGRITMFRVVSGTFKSGFHGP